MSVGVTTAGDRILSDRRDNADSFALLVDGRSVLRPGIVSTIPILSQNRSALEIQFHAVELLLV